MIARREFIAALGAGAFAASFGALAQAKPPAGKMWHIGFFYGGSRESAMSTGRYAAFLRGMRELGYVEGKNLLVEARFVTEFGPEPLSELAQELLRTNPDVIVSSGGAYTQALKVATSTVPIVFVVSVDPIGEGLAASLAHPGRNLTGLAGFLEQVFPKHVEMLKLAVPRLSRIGVLANSRNATHPGLLKDIEAVGRKNEIQVVRTTVDSLPEIERAVAAIAKEHCQAFLILGDTFFVQYFPRIATLASRYRLASIYSGREYPEAGGLMSYGPNFSENYHRAPTYVDKILRGAKPGDLPVEQPIKFELVVNRKAAHAIGIPLSQELLFRADKVIE